MWTHPHCMWFCRGVNEKKLYLITNRKWTIFYKRVDFSIYTPLYSHRSYSIVPNGECIVVLCWRHYGTTMCTHSRDGIFAAQNVRCLVSINIGSKLDGYCLANLLYLFLWSHMSSVHNVPVLGLLICQLTICHWCCNLMAAVKTHQIL